MESLRRALSAELQELEGRSLYRVDRPSAGAPGPWIEREGRRLLNLGSNNYLGLTEHPSVREAAREAVTRWGTGSSGSRLTSGTLALHRELERELARLKGAEAALLFPTGYMANIGTIPALVGAGDLVLSDALNHASLIDGCRLSRAEVRVYRHADVAHARSLLADRERFRRVLVVTDGVFSMDGDLAPLPALCDLCEERDAWLMVDDAHGTGVLGAQGGGTAEHLGVSERVPIRMGTLSKALAAEGGFIAGSGELVDYLRNRARSFIFATAPAPATAAAALAALEVLRNDPAVRRRLLENAEHLRGKLREIGFRTGEGETPIIPVHAGPAERALALAAALEGRGVWAPAIRPPTVPEGTSRIRVSVTAAHSAEELERVAETFAAAGREAGLL